MEKKLFTFNEIKQKMANYCAYQDRCHSEVEQKMREFVLIPEAKEEILLFLMRENYLNEERFTRSFIRGKFYQKQWGRNKIRQHLKLKGVPEKLMNSCFDEIDEEDYLETARKEWEKYRGKLKGLQAYQKNIKTTRYLMGRGFEWEVLQEIF